MDSLELRMAGSDQANRALLEQLMKLNQDIKVKSHEKMPKVWKIQDYVYVCGTHVLFCHVKIER